MNNTDKLKDKNWLAKVAAERLEEANDPELAYKRVCERSYKEYRRRGHSREKAIALVEADVRKAQAAEARDRGNNVVSLDRFRDEEQDKRMVDWFSSLGMVD